MFKKMFEKYVRKKSEKLKMRNKFDLKLDCKKPCFENVSSIFISNPNIYEFFSKSSFKFLSKLKFALAFSHFRCS